MINETLKALLRVVLLAIVFCIALGVGMYALAPDGTYTAYAVETVSHDWNQYKWGFLYPDFWEVLISHGILVGLASAVAIVPIALIVSAILFKAAPKTKQMVASANIYLCVVSVLVLGVVAGIVYTIAQGRNPGII